ncbi:SDR family oxidoreductase [Azospirillum argentinense]|uniref:SDR family oxidoreductase n=1 Tax=Azospirillum brasilense TaxID=192 RepID=A0A4D8Q8G8_AZOBR|nr:SDR family oxidoreductase [Azospirillum argentinense]QCO03699.1 SDR family oxidoreductase [Azospirillum argentinense]
MALNDYRVALVTGASSGIGAAATTALAEHGLTVHALARRADRLAALAEGHSVVPHTLDATDDSAVAALLAGIEPDVVVLNAGTSKAGALHELSAADVDGQLALNVGAVLKTLQRVLPGLIARNRGHIVLIGSVAGVYPLAHSTLYAATKAAIHTAALSLRAELAKTRIRVTEILPGRVRTEIHGRSLGDPEEARRRLFDGFETLEPEDIAEAIVYAVGAPQRVNVGVIEISPTHQAYGGNIFAPSASQP